MDDINSLLIDDFTKQEVDIALKQMAPGLDGMTHSFFSIIGIIFIKFGSNLT